MASQDYWKTGESQQYNQQPNQQQGYGGPNDQYGQHQQSSADPYGYLSSNQPTQSHGYNDGTNQSQYQQHASGSYGHHENPSHQPQYQSYTQQESYTRSSQYQYPQHGYNSQTDPNQVAEGDRGLLGAIGGAAAGGFAGHKVNHGFLGTLGGAYAGHKLEDAIKDKKKKDKKSGRRNSSSSSSSSSDDEKKKNKKYGAAAAMAGGGGAAAYMHHQNQQQHHQQQPHHEALAGNFSSSCTNITLDRDYDLIAMCSTIGGHQKLSSISLNDHLTNEWGQLKWQRHGGFGGSARNVRLVDGGRVLEAELNDGSGGWRQGYARLDERITNNDGELQYIG